MHHKGEQLISIKFIIICTVIALIQLGSWTYSGFQIDLQLENARIDVSIEVFACMATT